MDREVRMVPKDWKHPKYPDNSRYAMSLLPLYGGSFAKELAEWEEGNQKWNEGLREDWPDDGWVPIEDAHKDLSFEEWHGGKPVEKDYMPDWPEDERTHLMMYETCSEGTPISAAFETPEELAKWLTDNGASSFGDMTATYEQWLSTCKRGWVVSAIYANGKLESGVAAL